MIKSAGNLSESTSKNLISSACGTIPFLQNPDHELKFLRKYLLPFWNMNKTSYRICVSKVGLYSAL